MITGLRQIAGTAWLSYLNRGQSEQTLERTPEPCSVTTTAEQAESWDQGLNSNITIAYGLVTEQVLRVRESLGLSTDRIADIACGTGLFSQTMMESLHPSSVMAVDLSAPMLKRARTRLEDQSEVSVSLLERDARNLSNVKDDSFDLVTFIFAAHHLDHLDDVREALKECERICAPEGMICVMDLTRFPTRRITEAFYSTFRRRGRGVEHFNEDFYNSLYAAWTNEELRSCAPAGNDRTWVSLKPKAPLPHQFLLGIPAPPNRALEALQPRKNAEAVGERVVAPAFRGEFRRLRGLLDDGERRLVPVPPKPHLTRRTQMSDDRPCVSG